MVEFQFKVPGLRIAPQRRGQADCGLRIFSEPQSLKSHVSRLRLQPELRTPNLGLLTTGY